MKQFFYFDPKVDPLRCKLESRFGTLSFFFHPLFAPFTKPNPFALPFFPPNAKFIEK